MVRGDAGHVNKRGDGMEGRERGGEGMGGGRREGRRGREGEGGREGLVMGEEGSESSALVIPHTPFHVLQHMYMFP